MCAHHGADVEELVAVTNVVKAPWSQPLWEVGGKQEAGEEGEEEVVTVAGQAVARAAASPTAKEDPVKQRDSVKYKGDDEGSCPQSFTPLRELDLQKPGVTGQAGTEQGVSDGDGDKMLMQPAVHPAVGHDVVAIAYCTSQAVEAESAVVKEVADVAGLGGHGAEGVCAAGGEGVNADEQHVHQQGPGVAVGQEVQRGAEDAEIPQEVPRRQKMCPDVDGFVVHLEAAEDTVQCGAPWMAVPRDDAVLPEHLWYLVSIKDLRKLDAEHVCGQSDGAPPSLTNLPEPGTSPTAEDQPYRVVRHRNPGLLPRGGWFPLQVAAPALSPPASDTATGPDPPPHWKHSAVWHWEETGTLRSVTAAPHTTDSG